MADPKLERGGTNFDSSSSTTLTLFNTQTESVRKSANLINLPLPVTDSSGALVFDLLGTTREIAVRGKHTTSDATVGNFTGDLNSLIDGNQGNTGSAQIGYKYTPVSISGAAADNTIRVYVNDVNWDFRAGEPNTVEYNLILFEVDPSNSG